MENKKIEQLAPIFGKWRDQSGEDRSGMAKAVCFSNSLHKTKKYNKTTNYKPISVNRFTLI